MDNQVQVFLPTIDPLIWHPCDVHPIFSQTLGMTIFFQTRPAPSVVGSA